MKSKINEIVQNTLINLKKNYKSFYSTYMGFKKSQNLPAQRTKEWFKMREGKITGSECYICFDNVLFGKDLNTLISEKKGEKTNVFINNKYVFHGTLLEEVAVKLYEILTGTLIVESGFIEHPKYDFLGASTDGFIIDYKNLSGKCIEIKCPYSKRPLNILPEYYWFQMQLQMECNDIDECDYFCCRIDKSLSYSEFLSTENPKTIIVETLSGKYHYMEIFNIESKYTKIYKFDNEKFHEFLLDIENNSDKIKKIYYCKIDDWYKKRILRDKKWFNEIALEKFSKINDIIKGKKMEL